MIEIELTDRQSTLHVDPLRLEQAARAILHDHGPRDVQVSIAVVDDPTIHDLNRRFLQHDYPTDVLSFVMEHEAEQLEGEVIVSADTAVARAGEYGMAAPEELLLYVIHGVLHLVGFDDKSEEPRQAMRRAEQYYLRRCGATSRRVGAEREES